MTPAETRLEDTKNVALTEIKNFYMFSAFRSILEAKKEEEEEEKKGKQIEHESLEPFIGPNPFTRKIEDQKRFFGRDDETEEIVSLILSHRAVLIYAQSGAGKTSIFEAKVVPELKNIYGFEVLPRARVGIASVTEKQENLKGQEEEEEEEVSYKLDIHSFAEKNLDEFLTAYSLAYSLAKKKKSTDSQKKNSINVPILFVFDQFEELFTTFPPPSSTPKSGIDNWIAQRQDFFKQVTNVLENESRRVHVVFIIREEFLAELDRFVKFLPERLRPRFRLERLRKDAAIEAIKEPLKITKAKRLFQERNIRQEDVDKIIDSIVTSLLRIRVEDPSSTNPNKTSIVEGEFVEPIQLQVVCQRRFSEWDPEKKEDNRDQIRHHKFNWLQLKWFRLYPQEYHNDQAQADKESEDVDIVLKEFYEEAIHKAVKDSNVSEGAIRKVFQDKLITSSGTRAFVHQRDFIQGLITSSGIRAFLHLPAFIQKWTSQLTAKER